MQRYNFYGTMASIGKNKDGAWVKWADTEKALDLSRSREGQAKAWASIWKLLERLGMPNFRVGQTGREDAITFIRALHAKAEQFDAIEKARQQAAAKRTMGELVTQMRQTLAEWEYQLAPGEKEEPGE